MVLHFNNEWKERLLVEFLKFSIVGCLSVICLYVTYYFFLFYYSHTISYTIGYIVSFIINYILSVVFTFKVKSGPGKMIGFLLSHLINYGFQVLLLNIFIVVGINKVLSPIPVLLICVPTNFMMVRFFLRK